MVQVVTQEAFEKAVHDNMTETKATKEKAIEDTIKKFNAQKMDMSIIIKDLVLSDTSKQLSISKCVAKLNNASSMNSTELENTLKLLKLQCDKDLVHKTTASKEGVYDILINIMFSHQDNLNVCLAALRCMVSLIFGQPDILKKDDIILFNQLLDKQTNDNIILETLRWVSNCCVKHENNRQIIFKAEILKHLKNLLQKNKNPAILIEVCTVIRNLTLDDDDKVESQSNQHARIIALEVTSLLTKMLKDFKSNKNMISETLLTLNILVTRDEFCEKVDEVGGLQFILDVMVEYFENEKINRNCFKLLKVLAGNDAVKRNIMKKGGATLICSALDRHKSAAQSARYGLACISALALRDAENGKLLFEAGLCDVVMKAIILHEDNVNVIRNGSWAIRNMSVRCPENKKRFIQLQAEGILNKAIDKHKKAGHEIKSALRDLGCDVKLEEAWKGEKIQLTR